MKQILVAALAVVGLVSAASWLTGREQVRASALQQGMKIAVVDTERILALSNLGKKVFADLKTLQTQKETTLKSEQDRIRQLQTRFDQGRTSLSQTALNDLQKQIEDGQISLKRLQDDAQTELTRKRDNALANLDAQLMPVINDLGKQSGYSLIFRKFESGLVYVDDAIDVTNEVVTRLNQKTGP